MSDISISNFISSDKMNNTTLDDLNLYISKLNFISNIPENSKPCYNTDTYISKNAWFVKFRRRWAGEEGVDGLEYITKILDSCDQIYRMCLQKLTINSLCIIDDLKNLHTALKNSEQGFENLVKTYSDQKKVMTGYNNCKTKSMELAKKINRILLREKKFIKTTDGSENSDGSDEKNITLSLVLTEKSKTSFFTTNDMVLLKSVP